MASGQLLRWWSIATLGRLSTVTVFAADRLLIDTGPYRFVRHPSYTAILLVHLGAGLCFGNVLTVAVLVLPVAAALLIARTRRLIPLIY